MGAYLMNKEHFFIVVTGPTGVGKTDFVDALSKRLPQCIEVINADMGQLYTPLTIGTAKPNLTEVLVPHHLFNIVSMPEHFTALDFRKKVLSSFHDVWARGKIPVVVGGSQFYIKSLFFPPCELVPQSLSKVDETRATNELWQELHEVDPTRAAHIHPHDRYRIQRALEIWYTFGVQPSACAPHFDAPGTYAVYYITRERQELYARINDRTLAMFEQGWVEEVKNLDRNWKQFLLTKKLVGYPEIIAFAEGTLSKDDALAIIRQKTRAYAKRQETFWRSLKKELQAHASFGICEEINLTFLSADLYIDKLVEKICLYMGRLPKGRK
jgi:tRNA dimethylallyltransferase